MDIIFYGHHKDDVQVSEIPKKISGTRILEVAMYSKDIADMRRLTPSNLDRFLVELQSRMIQAKPRYTYEP